MLCVGEVELDGRARTVRHGGEELDMTATEFDLLAYLMERAGSVVERDELAREVLKRRLLANDRTLDMHVLKVRRKLGALPDGSERLRTVRAVGYLYAKADKSNPSDTGDGP